MIAPEVVMQVDDITVNFMMLMGISTARSFEIVGHIKIYDHLYRYPLFLFFRLFILDTLASSVRAIYYHSSVQYLV